MLSLFAQHSPSSSTWGRIVVFVVASPCFRLLLASSRLARAPWPVRFRAPRPSRSACLLIRLISIPSLMWLQRFSTCRFLHVGVDFRCLLVHLAFSWSGSSESNCWTESASSDSFQLLSELVVSNSSSVFRPFTTSDHVRVLAFFRSARLSCLTLPPSRLAPTCSDVVTPSVGSGSFISTSPPLVLSSYLAPCPVPSIPAPPLALKCGTLRWEMPSISQKCCNFYDLSGLVKMWATYWSVWPYQNSTSPLRTRSRA